MQFPNFTRNHWSFRCSTIPVITLLILIPLLFGVNLTDSLDSQVSPTQLQQSSPSKAAVQERAQPLDSAPQSVSAQNGSSTPNPSTKPPPQVTQPPKSTAVPAAELASLVPEVTNSDIFGCAWPSDYSSRINFCVKKAGLDLKDHHIAEHDMVLYGVLSKDTVNTLTTNCLKNNKCPGEYDLDSLKTFLKFWITNRQNFTDYRNCLQSNTEGMVKMCGSSSKVGKVISGSAGLHLNLLNIMLKLQDQVHANDTESPCLLKMAEAMHMTAAVYLHTGAYRENTVMCWNVVRNECNGNCSKLASELNCVHSVCANVSYDFFKNFGIWEWYFIGPEAVKKNCHVEDSVCTLPDKAHLFKSGDSFADKIRRKYKELSKKVEHVLHMPLHIVLIIFLSSFVAFIVLVSLCCMWHHGMLTRGERKRQMKYSRLLDPEDKRNSDQLKSLAAGDVEEDEFD